MTFQQILIFQQYLNTRKISFKRALLPLILTLLFFNEHTQSIIIQSLSDAFLQVSIFVAATLFLYYYLAEKFPQFEMSYIRQNAPALEIPLASFLGALPGCGGAIIVVTQFTKGQASFGSVVAVLTATMGDAAFLLLATRPFDGLIVLSSGLIVGTLSGYIVNKIHHSDYLIPKTPLSENNTSLSVNNPIHFLSRTFWKLVFIPSLIIAFLLAFQFNFTTVSTYLNTQIQFFGTACAFLTVLFWSFSSKGVTYKEVTAEEPNTAQPSIIDKVMQDTHFVTAWVIAAFVLYEVTITFLGLDLKSWFASYGIFAPLIGVLIGLLPGCGPQIVVTTLYIQGIIPFSALMANAISNDGDALFPAIALAPKAALMATLYSTIPALLIGYFVYGFFE
ncbi:putative manganese transporter [Pseudoalteromonas denitrificans]|uniref:Putative, 10TM heavy-metal exporter n=1 Tax=Pseudoalteromonas denitrificans DSM 6059 TaxID=1123010 RepID=A0A1I1M2S8_9GAMM|nr:putative manganese transporter [Pseudoalteromonas denitrificans]SFC79356.1 Putative, 10TM heavy-metal exporter [Pseudoalteromonas denitrificans DSM 6059]